MLILIAESKTMRPAVTPVTAERFAAHTPLYQHIADRIMAGLRDLTSADLAQAVKVSPAMGANIRRLIYDFPDRSTGEAAIRAYTGVVFRQLRLDEYDAGQTAYLDGKVRVISSLYGWLRPADIVRPYRFDFDTCLAPGDISFKKFWRKDVTIALVKALQEGAQTEILDLLPRDASACVDWKLVKRFARVIRADFRTPEMKAPASGRLKELRGRLLDHLISAEVPALADLRTYGSPDFQAAPELSVSGTLMFVTS